MADVRKIVKSLSDITKAKYQKVHDGKPPSSRKTLHQLAFEGLQGSAGQVAAILTQNPKPNRDQQENIDVQFGNMKKNVNVYCPKTDNTRDVLVAYNSASTEWTMLVKELRV